MTSSDVQPLWDHLLEAGVVAGDPPPAARPSPWFVRVMSALCGWIGAVCLLLFAALGFRDILDSAAALFAVGAAACGAAAALFRAKPDSDFAAQFGLALSLAGQGLVLLALVREVKSLGAVALTMALFQSVLVAALPNFVHRVWSVWAATTAVVVASAEWQLQAYASGPLALAVAVVWLNEFRFPRHGSVLRAAGYGLTLGLASAVVAAAESTARAHPRYAWAGGTLSGLALLWSVRHLLLREAVNPVSAAGLRIVAAASVLALAAVKAPGLAPAVLVLLLGFANGNRVLAAAGLLGLLAYTSFYYYSLELTLLQKSVVMAGTGAALLLMRLQLPRARPDGEQERAHA